jgi:hypothetical protein
MTATGEGLSRSFHHNLNTFVKNSTFGSRFKPYDIEGIQFLLFNPVQCQAKPGPLFLLKRPNLQPALPRRGEGQLKNALTGRTGIFY